MAIRSKEIEFICKHAEFGISAMIASLSVQYKFNTQGRSRELQEDAKCGTLLKYLKKIFSTTTPPPTLGKATYPHYQEPGPLHLSCPKNGTQCLCMHSGPSLTQAAEDSLSSSVKERRKKFSLFLPLFLPQISLYRVSKPAVSQKGCVCSSCQPGLYLRDGQIPIVKKSAGKAGCLMISSLSLRQTPQ